MDELCSLNGAVTIKTMLQCVGAVTPMCVVRSTTGIKCLILC